MQKKIILQIFLLLIIVIISVIFFKFYYDKSTIKKEPYSKIENTEQSNNLMSNIKYIAADKEGNEYIIFSKFAEYDQNQSDLILMKQVEGAIKFANSMPITIFANKAIYNKLNHDTNFYEKVLLNYGDHQITSDNLDLFFEKNLASISKNIIYKSLNTELRADKIEMDLLTKNSRIFMDEKLKKVRVITLN
tara:strand:+ start:808 stop:1380 length:573 start_codon:yes stop_codon:yes gene_type:complete